jgi:hypothetical protein
MAGSQLKEDEAIRSRPSHDWDVVSARAKEIKKQKKRKQGSATPKPTTTRDDDPANRQDEIMRVYGVTSWAVKSPIPLRVLQAGHYQPLWVLIAILI